MSWATPWIEKLREGDAVQFRPRGHSMKGRVESGQLVTVVPIDKLSKPPSEGDVVLCRVHGRDYLHLVLSVGSDGAYLIGNNRGGVNGWTRTVYGQCIKVEA